MASARSYPGLDLIRLAAAVGVAFTHLGYSVPIHQGIGTLYPAAGMGWVGVQVFFVISGFVITFSASHKRTWQEFAISRARRLYPAAWICATITALLVRTTINAYARTITLFPLGPYVSGVYWTLAVEVAFYALIAFAIWRQWTLHSVALALGGLSSAYWVIRSLGLDLAFQPLAPFEHYGVYFAVGMLLFERRSLLAAIGFVAAGMIGVYWFAVGEQCGMAAVVVWPAATLLCAILVFWNEPVVRVTHSWPTRTLGLMTYPLYLVHDAVGPIVLRLGVVAAIILSLVVAFAILPIETFLRVRLFARERNPLPTGNPL